MIKKNLLSIVGALALAACLSFLNQYAQARITSPSSSDADVWTAGPSGAEVVVDSSGNLLPTTDNDTTLGTSALRWATAYILDITVGDDLTVSDDVTVTGDLFTVPLATQTIAAGGTISVTGACNKLIRLAANANVTTDTTNTFTAPVSTNEGCIYHVFNTGGGIITLDDNARFDVPANVALGTGDGAVVAMIGDRYALFGTSDN